MTETASRRAEGGDAPVAHERIGDGPAIVLLPATLSSTRQLRGLARALAGSRSVLSVDRRMADASLQPLDVAVHIADLERRMEAEGIESAPVIGHSYGGCIALELAARRPERVRGVWAYEPPYAPAGSAATRARLVEVADAVARASASAGAAAAADVFLEAVAGRATLDALAPSARRAVHEAGAGAVADAALLGFDPDGLQRIACPVEIVTGGKSDRFYVEIADGLAARIPGATTARLEGADHMAPLLRPRQVAAAIEAWLR